MKPVKGYEAAEVYKGATEQLPPGGYIVKILDIKEEFKDWGSRLIFSFDINEGEYKDFYANNYRAQTQEDKKWKGVYRLNVPTDDGTDQDNWKQRRFKTDIVAIEESNPPYHWDWNEQGLKGKLVGALFGRKEYNINGKTGFYTECRGFRSAAEILEGHFEIPKDRLLEKDNTVKPMSAVPEGFTSVTADDDLPF